jgi:MFS transporter, DHA2 family, glioxin efflux transporter
VFINRLTATLHNNASNLDPTVVIFTGAAELRDVFSAEDMPGILASYMVGLKAAFAVALAWSGVAFLFSLTIPMRKLPTHTAGAGGPTMMA